MNFFRISKYNPMYRVNGIYQKDEWTSYGDIGKPFNGYILSEREYLTNEKNYTETIYELARFHGIDMLTINYLENPFRTKWEKSKKLTLSEAVVFMQDCFRDKCWGQLSSDNFVWEVGYDFYVHIGCDSTFDMVSSIAKKHNLFVEKWEEVTIIN